MNFLLQNTRHQLIKTGVMKFECLFNIIKIDNEPAILNVNVITSRVKWKL